MPPLFNFFFVNIKTQNAEKIFPSIYLLTIFYAKRNFFSLFFFYFSFSLFSSLRKKRENFFLYIFSSLRYTHTENNNIFLSWLFSINLKLEIIFFLPFKVKYTHECSAWILKFFFSFFTLFFYRFLRLDSFFSFFYGNNFFFFTISSFFAFALLVPCVYLSLFLSLTRTKKFFGFVYTQMSTRAHFLEHTKEQKKIKKKVTEKLRKKFIKKIHK